MSSELELTKRLDSATARKEEVLILVDAGWPYSAVSQALNVTTGVISGVMKRHRDKHGLRVVGGVKVRRPA
jgi:DNA-directed RNA polymerase specialized sigma24 family protein